MCLAEDTWSYAGMFFQIHFQPPVKFPQALLSVNNLLMPVMCQAGISQCFGSLPAFPSVIPRCEWAIRTWLLIGPLKGQMGQSPLMSLNKRGRFMGVDLLFLFSLFWACFEWGCTGLVKKSLYKEGSWFSIASTMQHVGTQLLYTSLQLLFTSIFTLVHWLLCSLSTVRRISNTALHECDVDSGWTFIIMGCNCV